MTRDSLFPARKAQAFLGRRLNIDAIRLHAQSGGKVSSHLRNIFLQLRTLRQHGHIDITDAESLFREFFHHRSQ